MKEKRTLKISINKVGGNASKNAKKYTISLPTSFIQDMGISESEREVILSYDNKKITIEKKEKEMKINFVKGTYELALRDHESIEKLVGKKGKDYFIRYKGKCYFMRYNGDFTYSIYCFDVDMFYNDDYEIFFEEGIELVTTIDQNQYRKLTISSAKELIKEKLSI